MLEQVMTTNKAMVQPTACLQHLLNPAGFWDVILVNYNV
jgi:hypothetical protein